MDPTEVATTLLPIHYVLGRLSRIQDYCFLSISSGLVRCWGCLVRVFFELLINNLARLKKPQRLCVVKTP